MTDKQVPNDSAETFRVRRDAVGRGSGYDDALVRDALRVTTVLADNAEHFRAAAARLADRRYQIDRDVVLHVAAADGENEDRVAPAEAGDFQPLCKAALPPFVIDAGRELRDVIGGRVRLEPADFAEVVDRVTGVAGGAA